MRWDATTVCLSVSLVLLFMPSLLGVWRRLFTTMASNPYIAGTHSAAFVTAPSEEVAKKLARSIVEQKLAACVNIIPKVTSIYVWDGKIEEDPEVIMMIKTRTSRVEELSKFVQENHPNDVAEVISMPLEQGNPLYLKWLGDYVKEKQ